MDKGQIQQADDKVKKARTEILDKRKLIAAALTTLFDLQAEFVSVSVMV